LLLRKGYTPAHIYKDMLKTSASLESKKGILEFIARENMHLHWRARPT
jgi:hypothetical protein